MSARASEVSEAQVYMSRHCFPAASLMSAWGLGVSQTTLGRERLCHVSFAVIVVPWHQTQCQAQAMGIKSRDAQELSRMPIVFALEYFMAQ